MKRGSLASICYVLACISFVAGVFFLARASITGGAAERKALEEQAIKEILLEAKRMQKSLEGDAPNITSNEILLARILWEVKKVRPTIAGATATITGLIYFAIGILLSGELFVIGILWTLKKA